MAGVRLGLAAAALATSFVACPALASGGFGCEAVDEGVNIVVQGGTSRSIPGMPFSFAARAEIGLPGTPEDFRAIDLGDALAQYWANGDDLKLRLYRERDEDPFGWIDIVIETVRSGDEEEPWMFEGSYTL